MNPNKLLKHCDLCKFVITDGSMVLRADLQVKDRGFRALRVCGSCTRAVTSVINSKLGICSHEKTTVDFGKLGHIKHTCNACFSSWEVPENK